MSEERPNAEVDQGFRDEILRRQGGEIDGGESDEDEVDNALTDAAELVPSRLSWIGESLGLKAVSHSCRDVKLLIAQRFIRMLVYGQTTLILALFFQELQVSDQRIGYFMTLTLIGDVILSYGMTFYADQIGRRKILFYSGLLMLISGVIFATSSNYWLLLIAAVVGVISPSGDETGPFKSIEESTVAHLTPYEDRPMVFAWYGMLGTLGSAIGSLSGGLIIGYLEDIRGMDTLDVYRIIFIIYAVAALLKMILSVMLSSASESEIRAKHVSEDGGSAQERESLLPSRNNIRRKSSSTSTSSSRSRRKNKKRFLGLSKKSQKIVFKLCLLFFLDSFAYGFLPISWMVVYFNERFGIREATMGQLLFSCTLVGSLSALAAAHIYTHLGPIKAMVSTHLPSAILITLVPFAPSSLIAMALLVGRALTSTLDVVPRQTFLASIVRDEERTKIMAIVNLVKTFARSIGPAFVGKLAQSKYLWVSFLIGGVLEISYDIGLLATFLWIDNHLKEGRRI